MYREKATSLGVVTPIRVMIADDHAIIRAGVRKVLAGQTDMVVAGEASDGQETLQLLHQQPFDILVLDLCMPGKDGIELLKLIGHQYPELRVLILTSHQEDHYAVRALRAGAAGYMCKEGAPQLLVSAIRTVANGGRYISPHLAEKLLLEWSGEKSPLHSTLSDREFQILEMLAGGKTISAIAEELSLSVKTVSTHKIRLQHKLGMKNTTELVQYALKNQLLNPQAGLLPF